MKSIIIAMFASIFTFLFLNKPFLKAIGGSTKLWIVILFDVLVGIGVYFLIK